MNKGDNASLRAKTSTIYPPFLWIISCFLGMSGAYFSQIGVLYYLTADALLWFSAWLIIIGLFILFMGYNDIKSQSDEQKSGVFSIINHPIQLGQYLLIIGLNMQSVNLFSIAITLFMFSFYHGWLLHKSWRMILNHKSFYKINIWLLKDSGGKIHFKESLINCSPYILFTFFYMVLLIELRNRSIGRSLLDVFTV